MQLADVGVLQLFHGLDLPLDRLSLLGIVELKFRINLYRHPLLCFLVLSQLHLGVGTLAKKPDELVLSELLLSCEVDLLLCGLPLDLLFILHSLFIL